MGRQPRKGRSGKPARPGPERVGRARGARNPASSDRRKQDARPAPKSAPSGRSKQIGAREAPLRRKGVTLLRVSERSALLAFLLAKLPDEGRNSVKSLLSHRQVSIDGEVVTRFDRLLSPGERVTIARSRAASGAGVELPTAAAPAGAAGDRRGGAAGEARTGARETLSGLRILFEDAHLIVIDKAAGLLSIATERERDRTAYSILWDHVRRDDPKGRIYVVHRLDRESSGVMVYAKSPEAKRGLQEAWREAVERRTYAVAVEGRVTKGKGTIISWLKEDRSLVMRSSPIDNGGQRAVSHYRVVQSAADYSLLEVELETGRKNQIRAHMQAIGHSVVGDAKYGASGNPIGRLALHARLLSFRHPITGKPMSFESPIPPAFQRLVGRAAD